MHACVSLVGKDTFSLLHSLDHLLRRDAHLVDGVHAHGLELVLGRGVDARVLDALGQLAAAPTPLQEAKVRQVEHQGEPENLKRGK